MKPSGDRRKGKATVSDQAVKALKRSGDMYRSLFDSMGDGFLVGELIRDENGHPSDFAIVDINSVAEKQTGLAREQLVGRRATGIVPFWKPAFFERLDRVVRSGKAERFDMPHPVSGKWFETNACPLHDRDRFALTFRDITERKRIEDALRHSESFLNNVFDCIQDGISILDRDLNIVRTNQVMEKWYPHVTPLKNRKCYDAYHSRSAPCDVCPSKKAIQLKTTCTEIVPFRGEGGADKGWLSIHSYPLTDDEGNVIGVIEHVRDVTAYVHGREALRESEEKYRFLVENAKDVTWKVDLQGKWTFVSSNVEKLTGYRPDEIVGKMVWDFLPPECHEYFREKIRKRIRGEEIPPYEGKIISKDGRSLPFEVHTSPILDRDGAIVGIQGVSRDIYHRKQAEKALRGSETKFRALFENTGAAIFIIDDATGAIIDCNSNGERLIGRSQDEIMQMSVLQLHPPEDMERHRANIMRQAMAGQIVNYEADVLHKDGRRIPVLINATPITIDDRVIMMGVFLDITERKRAEDALCESEERFRAVFDRAAVGIAVADLHGYLIDSNPVYQTMMGYTRDELRQKRIYDITCPEDVERCRDLEMQLNRGLINKYQTEKRYIRKDGQVIWARINVSAIRDRDGSLKYNLGVVEDITDHRRAEEALRESEEKFRVLAETASVAISIMQDGKFAYINPAMEAISGYTKEELQSMDFLRLVHPDVLERVKSQYGKWINGDSAEARAELKGISKKGEVRWADVSRKTISYHGRPAILITGVDITVRKRAEEALRHSEERYRQLTENSADFIYIIDRDYRVQFVNNAGAEALGIPPENATGKGLGLLFPPDTFTRMKKGLEQVFETGKPHSAEMVHKFYGGDYYIHVVLTPLFDGDGKVSSVMGVSRDINDLKRAEAAMRESEEKFRVLAETSPAAICVFREDEFIYVNPAVERISGYSREEFFQTKMWNLLVPGCRGELIERAEARKLGKQVPSSYELSFVSKSGEPMWVNISLGPINIGGSPAYIVSAFDITERKRAEKELMEAKAQAELYLDLLGHDINNMHQMALGYLEIARDAGTDESQKVFLEKPIEVLQRSAQLIRNVRKLQKAREGSVSMQTIDLCTVLSDLCKEYEALPDKSISADFKGHSHCYVRANELLYDVFSNLVGNAVRHTPDHARISISLDTHEEGNELWYTVSVEDDGQGIPDDFKGIIFNRSFKGTSRKNGMGIGLYLVKTLVDSYHGLVWVEDRVPGNYTKGTKFLVRLPAETK